MTERIRIDAVCCPAISPLKIEHGLRRGLYRHDEDLGLERRCPRCGEYWPFDTEFWALAPDGVQSSCKCCQIEMKQARLAAAQQEPRRAAGGL